MDRLNFEEFRDQARRTDAPLDTRYPHMHSIHMILGMLTEVGELADVYKKNLAYKRPLDWPNIKEELGDLMWYIANFCTPKQY